MKTLHLTLKKKWFDMILLGEKKEEYRELNAYWSARFIEPIDCKRKIDWNLISYYLRNPKKFYRNYNSYTGFFVEDIFYIFDLQWKDYDFLKLYNSFCFNKNAPNLTLSFRGSRIGIGYENWGAHEGDNYFVVKLGKVIETKNC